MILIVLNSSVSRIDSNIKKMLTNFKKIFGANFKNNIGFIYTHWGLGESDVEDREYKGIT